MQYQRFDSAPPRASAQSRAPRRWRSKRKGQAIVEFALVSGPLFACIFGLIEFALIMTSVGAYNFGAKEGARLGSILGRQSSTVDSQVISLIQSRTSGLAVASISEIDIYDADPYTGNVKTVGGTVMDNVYTFDGSGNITSSSAPWSPDLRNDTLADADYLGVKVTFKYTYLTAFLSGGSTALTLTASSVQRIEPLDYLNDIRAPAQVASAMPATDPGNRGDPGTGLPPASAVVAAGNIDEPSRLPLARRGSQPAQQNEVDA